ncbi:HNH endonuclease [Lactiplantibacillus plantarum]|uniref:HNH endonuclease n=1 Tax=Lactiplantibacillus plantarum TaxID=1590 RepID=UPI00374C9942
MTVYKKIPRYEGIYEASDHGTIWSVEGKKTTRKMKNGQIQKRIWKRRQIMPKREKRPRSKHSDLRVDLWKNGSHKTKLVSRLVASAFIPNPENKPCINHIDGNPLNNVPKNLEWCTYKENQKHAFKTGLNKSSKRVVLVGSYDNIQHSFISMAEASNFLGMSHGFISGLVNRGITNFGEYKIIVQREE